MSNNVTLVHIHYITQLLMVIFVILW